VGTMVNFIKKLAQIINRISEIWQNKFFLFNLCQNCSGTTTVATNFGLAN
jgi:hypothetical protein